MQRPFISAWVSRGLVALLVITSLLIAPPNPAAAITGDPFRFIYDQLGRLVAAVTPTDSAKYTYDAVGNITAITRQVATTLAVIEFAPHAGPTGTTVTIYGTAFSTTPSQNTVKFNNTTATVTSATTTQIVTTVPAGATTGTISVKVGGKTATSSASFTVGSTTATISGFTPSIVNPGDTVTVNGTNFDAATLTNNATTFDNTFAVVTAATATTLTTVAPPNSGSGPVVVRTPNGIATSSGDLFIAPTGFTAAQVGPTARVAPGQAQTLNFTVPGKVGLLLVSVNAGQHLVLTITNGLSSTYNLTIRGPDGAALYGPMCCNATYAETGPVSITGTYTAVFDPGPSGTGSVTVNAYAPTDVTTSVTPTPGGATAALTTTTPGQNLSFTFSGTQYQRISLSLAYSTGLNNLTTVKNPDGTTNLWGPSCCSASWIELTLTQTGVHTIAIDPAVASIGTVTLTAYDVPADPSASLTIGGSANLTTTTPGQNMSFTLTGTAGHTLSVTLTASGGLGNYTTTVKNPDGSSNLWGPDCCFATSIQVTITQSGTHTILVDPSVSQMGSMGASLISALAPIVPTLAAVDGPRPALAARAVTDVVRAPASPTASPRPVPSFKPPRESAEWIPGASARSSWRLNGPDSPWRAELLPEADPGVTALAGQVLALNGQPLDGIVVSVGDIAAATDMSGQFLLAEIPAGVQELMVDGGLTHDSSGAPHGVFVINVDVHGGGTNRLPFTIWLPALDTAHTVRIASPTTTEVVLTTPHIPGLEVHIPAGTTITGEDGDPVTEIGITAIPVDRPPFPLPALQEIPVYFTIQPGGAYLSKKARIVYPNYTDLAPGTRENFWTYDPEERGWYVYGQGQVTPDGKQVVPDEGIGIYEFTGAMFGGSLTPPGIWAALGNFFSGGDPVDLGTGLFILDKTDLALPDTMPLSLTRTYRQSDTVSRAFGIGTSHPYASYLWSANPYAEVDLILPDGGRVHFLRISSGTGWTDAVFEHTSSPTRFYKSRIWWNGGGWDLQFKDGTKLVFADNGPLQYIQDRFGNRTLLDRGTNPYANIATIRSPNGRWISLHYDGSGRIDQAKDNAGRTVSYVYNAAGYLWKVTDVFGQLTEYTYDASNRMRTIKDARQITFLTIDYDANTRVWKQTQADSTFFQFDYVLDQNGRVTQTDVTDPRGFVRRSTFNAAGYGISDTAALGQAIAQTTSYEVDPATNLVTSVSDALGRVTRNTYDATGNLATTTSLYGTPDAVMTTFTYAPAFGELASVKDPLDHTTSFGYDTRGNRTTESDALGHITEYGYNWNGQLTSTKNALQKITTFAYLGADLVSITDPLGRITTRVSDAAGRPVAVTDPLGNKTRTGYDTLNRATQVVDSLGGITAFTYDENGNRLSVKDAKLNTTIYTYNTMDRMETRKDALLRTESYTYDANGNLLTVTDRKGQVTELRYDALDRESFAGFGRTGSPPTYSYQSTIDYTYDIGNRLHVATDSISGSITREYDGLDRMWSETTGQGVVTYVFDRASRRTQLQVAGQTAVIYGYDNADRLMSITQGSTAVGFGYDNADRRTTLTLPGNLLVEYGYDDGSQLLSLTYKRSGSTIGAIAYSYDQKGRRATTSGTYARLNLPAAVSSGIYNANNQLTSWAGTTISYDNNGNMLGDGVNSYSWNARDQLSAVTKSGQTLPSFTYDAFGRRQKKTLGATVTSYLYDGANSVQELTGATPTANMLTGLGVDEVFRRTESAATRTFLSDALGSTVALADTAGVVQTSYTYAPYGATTFTGTSSTNGSQYTGRENDNDGLYFYRARYYHPVFSRFTSEDPIEFGGGDANLYEYGAGSPTNFTDPSGNCAVFAALGAALTISAFVLSGRKSEKTFGDWVTLGVNLALDIACVGIVSKLRNIVMIGETQGRVRSLAKILGGRTMPTIVGDHAFKLAENARWIGEAMDKGRTIVDLGRNSRKVLRGDAIGEFYKLEQDLIRARGYERVIQWPSGSSGQLGAFLRILRM
jgi:RHS repeat-associated protein